MNDPVEFLRMKLEQQMQKSNPPLETVIEIMQTLALAKLSGCVSEPNKDGERVFIIWESITRTTLSGIGPK